ncbi:MAG: YdhR family protein, partial [Anaerolineae bacterium]|nr:YdhR family protein [Anaerolineae bacterium]
MSERLLQVNFKFNVKGEEYEEAAASLADEFAALDGLRWKIWMINEDEKEAGGIYMFEDEKAPTAFLKGPLAEKVTT